jgi:ABC-type branched-subunit amino acid transport system ATPase component
VKSCSKASRYTALTPDAIVKMGISQVPEGRHIFPSLTVAENLDMGAFLRRDKKGISNDRDYLYSLFPILRQRRNQPGGNLSGGEQQMLAISRALMARPQLLLARRAFHGPLATHYQTNFHNIQHINKEQNTTIFLVEQNANLALQVANRGYVLENGRITMEDRGETLRINKDSKSLSRHLKPDGQSAKENGTYKMNKNVKVGVIGVGYLGRFHAHKYAAMEGVELVGVADADPERAHLVADECATKPLPTTGTAAPGGCCLHRRTDPSSSSRWPKPVCAGLMSWWKNQSPPPCGSRRPHQSGPCRQQWILQVGHLERFNPAVLAMQPLLTTPCSLRPIALVSSRSGARMSMWFST